jgi:manganese/iron transport system permease protein
MSEPHVHLTADAVAAGSLAAPLVAAVLIGLTCAATGVYVVLRRMAFVGDALAHTVLPGLVLATLLGVSPFAGAIAAGVATAFAIGWLSRRAALREDTAIGVVFTAMFAFGLLLGRMGDHAQAHEFEEMLFGELRTIGWSDVATVGVVALVVLGALALLHKELELASFDPRYAEVIGVRTDGLRYALLALLALTVVSGIQAVGVLLTGALLVTPAAAASLLTNGLGRMMAIAAAIAVGSTVAGLLVAERFAVASGAVIVLVCTACFAVAWLLRRRAGGP